jgi:Flp pilus assembly pilin Flp
MKELFIITLIIFTTITTHAQWTQIGIDINGEAIGDFSGRAISLNTAGNIIAIGALQNDGNGMGSGHVRIYEDQNGEWIQLGQDIDGENAGDESGYSVSLNSSGSIVAIGARSNEDEGYNTGQVRIYQLIDDSWSQLGQDINGENIGDEFGEAVSLNNEGTIVAISSVRNDYNGNESGMVRVFSMLDTAWEQVGNRLYGTSDYDSFGHSLDLNSDGTILAVGAVGFSGEGTVSVYELIDTVWTQIGSNITGKGAKLSINGNGSIIAIANPGSNSETGSITVYKNVSGTWSQMGNEITGEATGDLFGTSVSISEDGYTIAGGAEYNDGNGENSGHVRIYQFINEIWTQVGNDINGEESGDQSGISVSLNGDGTKVAIGAPWNASNGLNAGHVRVFEYSSSSIENIKLENFTVFPNPLNNILNIDFKVNTPAEISICDIQGRTLFRSKTEINKNHIFKVDLSKFETGIYILGIKTQNRLYNTKIIKE